MRGESMVGEREGVRESEKEGGRERKREREREWERKREKVGESFWMVQRAKMLKNSPTSILIKQTGKRRRRKKFF